MAKTAVAGAAAAVTAGATIAACVASAPGPAATTAGKRVVKAVATPAGISLTQGAKICRDLNAWLAGSWPEPKPRFTYQMEMDEVAAGDGALGSDLAALDFNLVNFNSAALRNSPPDYYPVTGLAALQHDCTGYGVTVPASAG